jgi:hypothetical protein
MSNLKVEPGYHNAIVIAKNPSIGTGIDGSASRSCRVPQVSPSDADSSSEGALGLACNEQLDRRGAVVPNIKGSSGKALRESEKSKRGKDRGPHSRCESVGTQHRADAASIYTTVPMAHKEGSDLGIYC